MSDDSRKGNIGKSQALTFNRAWWNERSSMHAKSKFYNLDAVINGEQRLNNYEVEEMGPVKGKKLLHFQCHLGVESVNWARLGAKVSGLDFSSSAIEEARKLAELSRVSIDYRVGNVYQAGEVFLGKKFDFVYISIGSLHWLPDINRWARSASTMLKKNGILYINDIHPFSSTLGDKKHNAMKVVYDYFNRGPVVWNDSGSYADTEETINNKHIIYDRPMSDIIMAVINSGFELVIFNERQGQEYQQFEFQVKHQDGRWYNPPGMGTFPSTFSLKAIKRQEVWD